MFRNLRVYRLDTDWPDNEQTLSDKLDEAAFEPCGPLTDRSAGFVPVAPDSGDLLARRVNGADLLRLRTQTRIMPTSAVNEALEGRIDEFTKRTGEAPSAREKRRLKAEIKDELLPKAMLRSDRTWGFVDPKLKIVAIDVAQSAAAERFLRRLRAPFGGLNSRPLGFARPVTEVLTRIFLGDEVGRFSLGRECRMRDPGSAKSSVRWTDFDLTESAIRHHVADGMQLTHLGVVFGDVMSCVVDEDGIITKIRFLGVEEETEDGGNALARQDAEFVLLTGTIRQLLADLQEALGGYA